ncbi:hypothetical protein CRG98_010448 [Punica granatum]|uniref:Uncharacterized protein n=1 Tax=Punica granatum TaxID=22663 RepID=A0A2I0KL03_PUNGR|nr:hypothetical protein CRG98_010448 [Punica granatum]
MHSVKSSTVARRALRCREKERQTVKPKHRMSGGGSTMMMKRKHLSAVANDVVQRCALNYGASYVKFTKLLREYRVFLAREGDCHSQSSSVHPIPAQGDCSTILVRYCSSAKMARKWFLCGIWFSIDQTPETAHAGCKIISCSRKGGCNAEQYFDNLLTSMDMPEGRLTLTNYALYFEASGVINYEDAVKIDLSKDKEGTVRPAATGPWGAPLFDKAMAYESPELKIGTSVERLEEEFAAEWRAESSGYSRKFVEECVGKEKEEKKRLMKVPQENDEVPLFYSDLMPLLVDHEPDVGEDAFVWLGSLFPLVADVVNGRFTFETLTAPTASRLHFPAYDKFLKEIDQSEGFILEFPEITSSTRRDHWLALTKEIMLMHRFLSKFKELLKPLTGALPWLQETLTWERPVTTLAVLCITILVLYEEWVNKAVAAFSLWLVVKMLQHADAVMVALSVSAMVLAVIPLKYILMGVTVYSFAMNSRMGKHIESDRGNRRLKEWWDSIPVVPVRVVDKAENCPKK